MWILLLIMFLSIMPLTFESLEMYYERDKRIKIKVAVECCCNWKQSSDNDMIDDPCPYCNGGGLFIFEDLLDNINELKEKYSLCWYHLVVQKKNGKKQDGYVLNVITS